MRITGDGVLGFIALLCMSAPAYGEEVGVYDIWFDEGFRYATIDAAVELDGGLIATGQGGGEAFERNWLTFVEGLTATSPDDGALDLEVEEFENFGYTYYRWQVTTEGKPYSGPARLKYRLNLASGREKHPFGNEQGMQVFESAFYTTTRPLFVTSEIEGTRRVRFHLPGEWDVRVPWPPSGDHGNSFAVPSLQSLQNNPVVIGRFAVIDLDVLDLEFSLLLPGEIASSKKQILDVFAAVKPAYETLFPDTPPDIYNMVFFYSYAEDGEGFQNGSAFTTTRELVPETRVLWADFLVHEFLHYWNGRRIRAEERWEQQWISEGFTDFLTALILVNRRVVDHVTFEKIAEQQLANYLFFMNSSIYAGVSVRESGKDKGRNRPGVYSGGWVMALALDYEIQKATNGERNLTDFMRALYVEFGLSGRSYSFDDIRELAKDVSGVDMRHFFDTYVDARNEYPVGDIMEYYGLIGASKPYANEFYILEDPGATEAQRERWAGLREKRF